MTCVQCPANPVRTPRENRLETQWDTLNARTARPAPYRPDTRSRSATNVRQAPFQTRKKRSVSVSINNTITALSVHVSLCVCVPAKAQKLQRVRLRQNGKIYRKCVRIGWRSNMIARSVILSVSPSFCMWAGSLTNALTDVYQTWQARARSDPLEVFNFWYWSGCWCRSTISFSLAWK